MLQSHYVVHQQQNTGNTAYIIEHHIIFKLASLATHACSLKLRFCSTILCMYRCMTPRPVIKWSVHCAHWTIISDILDQLLLGWGVPTSK